MRAFAVIGILLILLGAVAITYQGITYMKRDTVVNVGPVNIETERPHTVPVPPIIGAIAIVAGAAFTIFGMRRCAGCP